MNSASHDPEKMPSTQALRQRDEQWLRAAIELSRRAPLSSTSYAVGAIITSAEGSLIADGFSLELGDKTHAEEVALAKAATAGASVAGATMYSSLEPCSIRLSGNRSCTSRIIEAGIQRVVFALREPPRFVKCEGISQLQAAGIEVVELTQLAPLVAQVNRHLSTEEQ